MEMRREQGQLRAVGKGGRRIDYSRKGTVRMHSLSLMGLKRKSPRARLGSEGEANQLSRKSEVRRAWVSQQNGRRKSKGNGKVSCAYSQAERSDPPGSFSRSLWENHGDSNGVVVGVRQE